MKAIVLAAGYGTRLYPLTLNRPKPLLKVGAKTIIDRIAEKIEKISGIDEIYIVTNGRFAAPFEDWLKKSSYKKPIKVINDGTFTNETRLGAVGDLELVVEKERINTDLLIIGGDNLFDFELSDFIEFARRKRRSAVAVRDIGDLNEAKKYGIVRMDENERVTEFAEKPERPKSTLAAMCVYYIPKDKLGRLDVYLKSGGNKDAPGHFISWLSENDEVFGYRIDGEWFDIGDKRLLRLADEIFTKREEKK